MVHLDERPRGEEQAFLTCVQIVEKLSENVKTIKYFNRPNSKIVKFDFFEADLNMKPASKFADGDVLNALGIIKIILSVIKNAPLFPQIFGLLTGLCASLI